MPRYADYTEFAKVFTSALPRLSDLEVCSNEFWQELEMNAERILHASIDAGSVADVLSPLGVGGLQLLCQWVGVDPLQAKADLILALAAYVSENIAYGRCQTIVLLNSFLYRKRTDATESICRLLLPRAQFDLVRGSGIDANSRRFCYSLATYIVNPHHLRLLMLYESAERAGYTRFVLVPQREDSSGKSIDGELVREAEQQIEEGADLESVDIGMVNDVLDVFERAQGHRESLCFDLYRDSESAMILVFILRYLRESYIREVEDVVFGDEAELIVLRLYDRMHSIDEHSQTGSGVRIAAKLASKLLGTEHVRYIEDAQTTDRASLENLLQVLEDDSDERIRLREVYLESAPLDEAPTLIVRCDKSDGLAKPLQSFREHGIDLLADLQSLRNVKIAFVVPSDQSEDKEDAYSFTVYLKRLRADRYFLPYAAANIAMDIRGAFETYLRNTHNVKVVPGTA